MDEDTPETSVTLAPEGDNVVSLDLLPIQDDTSFHLEDNDVIDNFAFDKKCTNIRLQIEVTDVIRGKTSKGKPATLVLFRLRFLYFTNIRPLQAVTAKLSFRDSKNRTAYTPEVMACWPEGVYTMDEYEYKSDENLSLGTDINTAPPGLPIGGEVSINWERTESGKRKVDRASISGTTFRGEGMPRRNGFELRVEEGKNCGVVPDMRVSVLLQHPDKDEMDLGGTVAVSAEAGLRFGLEWRMQNLGRDTDISPEVFTPRTSSMSAAVNPLELDLAELEQLSGVGPKKVIIRGKEEHHVG